MITRNRLLLLNSTVALVLAGTLTVTLHELAHFATALALGHEATLHATSVSNSSTDDATAITTAAAGPIFSILFGLIIVFAARRWGRGFWRLLWMWLGFTSAQAGFGYCMIALLSPAGETGKVLELLGAPWWVGLISLAFGTAGMLWLSRLFATRVAAYAGEDTRQMMAFGMWPWLFGTLALVVIYAATVLQLPFMEAFLSMFGIIAIGVFAPMFTFFVLRLHPPREQLELGVPWVGIAGVALMVLLILLVLVPGITLG
ncbi:hypothetical protein [Agrococcus sp. KRD186]|uniref:hypothetical protein n=1 Tax=Agrococcus sp. KRD186 TaxID=2729730 RepID=UPI0019D03C1D|nr:hypothetical protein [Agrococcus sp. KRD186]